MECIYFVFSWKREGQVQHRGVKDDRQAAFTDTEIVLWVVVTNCSV